MFINMTKPELSAAKATLDEVLDSLVGWKSDFNVQERIAENKAYNAYVLNGTEKPIEWADVIRDEFKTRANAKGISNSELINRYLGLAYYQEGSWEEENYSEGFQFPSFKDIAETCIPRTKIRVIDKSEVKH